MPLQLLERKISDMQKLTKKEGIIPALESSHAIAYAIKIAKKLQSIGYRGIGGIDYLLKDNCIYFMEVNPRFQASSEYLDKLLIDKGLPGIFELNYLAFYDETKFIDFCNKIKG